MNFDYRLTEVCSFGVNVKAFSIDSRNGLAPTWRQVIFGAKQKKNTCYFCRGLWLFNGWLVGHKCYYIAFGTIKKILLAVEWMRSTGFWILRVRYKVAQDWTHF